MYNALTNTGKTCRVITNVTSRKPCRCLAFGVLAINGPRDCRVLDVFSHVGNNINWICSLIDTHAVHTF
jgi:hypothetical protein